AATTSDGGGGESAPTQSAQTNVSTNAMDCHLGAIRELPSSDSLRIHLSQFRLAEQPRFGRVRFLFLPEWPTSPDPVTQARSWSAYRSRGCTIGVTLEVWEFWVISGSLSMGTKPSTTP